MPHDYNSNNDIAVIATDMRIQDFDDNSEMDLDEPITPSNEIILNLLLELKEEMKITSQEIHNLKSKKRSGYIPAKEGDITNTAILTRLNKLK